MHDSYLITFNLLPNKIWNCLKNGKNFWLWPCDLPKISYFHDCFKGAKNIVALHWNMKTNMAAVIVTAYCHVTCSLTIASLYLGNFFWTVLKGWKLKCLHISVVFFGLFASKVNPGVIIRINRLAKVDGILQLLTEHPLTRVSRHLQKEETGVGFRKVVVWGRVFVKHLKRKTSQNYESKKPTHFAVVLGHILTRNTPRASYVKDQDFSQLYLRLLVYMILAPFPY